MHKSGIYYIYLIVTTYRDQNLKKYAFYELIAQHESFLHNTVLQGVSSGFRKMGRGEGLLTTLRFICRLKICRFEKKRELIGKDKKNRYVKEAD